MDNTTTRLSPIIIIFLATAYLMMETSKYIGIVLGKNPLYILGTLMVLVVSTVITVLRRKKPKYCLEIQISRTSPYTMLVRDLEYLSRLAASLSKQYGETKIIAPVNGKALLCTGYNEIHVLADLIDKNTSTLLVNVNTTNNPRTQKIGRKQKP